MHHNYFIIDFCLLLRTLADYIISHLDCTIPSFDCWPTKASWNLYARNRSWPNTQFFPLNGSSSRCKVSCIHLICQPALFFPNDGYKYPWCWVVASELLSRSQESRGLLPPHLSQPGTPAHLS